jgi:drug/metabolite transporter (DMT)-like permease
MRFVPAVIVDAVLVLVFAVIGRASHGESPGGFLITAWPFIVALLLGHVVAALLPARPRRPWSLGWGAVVWLVTVTGGLLLRVVAGDTAQIAFIIVTTLVLGVFLVGWRAAAAFLRRRAGRTSDTGAVHERSDEEADDEAPAEGIVADDEQSRAESAPEADPGTGAQPR